MARRKKVQPEHIYLGEWLDLFEVSQTEAAKMGQCTPSYVSNLVANRREAPNALILLRISNELGITVNDLYRRPPPREHISSVARLSPAAESAVLRRVRRKA